MHTNINTHIQDYHECRISDGLHCLDARIKLAMLVVAVGTNVYFAQLWLSVMLFVAGTTLAMLSRIPLRLFLLFFIIPAWSTIVVAAGFSAGFGATPIFSLGPITFYREGLHLGLAAAARVASDMSWVAAIILTTPFNALLRALRWFRVPSILVDTIAMGYRYMSLIMKEFTRMKNSAHIRGGFQSYRLSLQSTARILAQVVLRSYDRAIRIQEAMTSRGAYASDEDVSTQDNDEKPVDGDEHCPNRCDVTPEYKDTEAPVLRCCHLTHAFGELPTLQDVSFSIEKKEVVVLCGPNGAGKTTLLKLLSGILTPTRGEIYLEGELLNQKSKNKVFQHVGFLCQDPNDQLFCTHVREDVSYGPTNLKLPPEKVRQLADTAMELLEVSDLADRPIHRLSYGQMKRVGLAGLIAMKPPLLLLDEPSSNLDPASSKQLIHHLCHLNKHHGYTFVIVTHDMNLAAQIADRIVILDKGKIVADGKARKILTDEKLLSQSRLEPPILTQMFQRLLGDPLAVRQDPFDH